MSLLLILWLACSGPSSKEDAVRGTDEATAGDTVDELDTGVEVANVPLAIELGTGEWEWEPLEAGADLPVIQGPQGGFHFLASVRVSGIEAGTPDDLGNTLNPTTTFWVIKDGEHLAPTSRFVQGLDPAPEQALPYRNQMIGRFVIMDISSDDELDGVEVELGVRIQDVHGLILESSLMVMSYPHPLNH